MNLEELSSYLSQESISKVSLHACREKDETTDEDICLLTDGTLISIDTVRGGLKLPEGFLSNPNKIEIASECMAIVKYKENDTDEKYKNVRFRVTSLPDLENQWKKYCSVKNIGDKYGIISEITMTKDQIEDNYRVAILVNQWINIMLGTNVDVFQCEPSVGRERYKLIQTVITNSINGLIFSGAVNKVYSPTALKDQNNNIRSIVEYIDRNLAIRIASNARYQEEEDYEFEDNDEYDQEEDENN